MSPQKIIAVVGATGNQGSSVVNTFLALPGWSVRALTRTTTSPAAQHLATQGATVVQANLEDVSSLEDAFRGAHAIFLNTDFWIPYGVAMSSGKYERHEASAVAFETELRHSRNAADAAVRVGGETLGRFVYSALGPMKEVSGEKYPHCGHWDAKAASADYIEGVLQGKASFYYPAAYSTNPFLLPQIYPHIPSKSGEEEYTLLLPAPITAHFPIVRERDSTGPFVRALVEDEEPGLKLLGCDCDIPIRQALDDWMAVTGKQANFVQTTEEEMHKATGLPYEVLDGPGYLGEYDFMAGVKGKVIRPEDLKNKVAVKTYKEILESRTSEELLGSQHPEL